MITSKLEIRGGAEPTYPMLCKWKDSDLVVLFTAQNIGVCVVSDSDNELGKYSQTWARSDSQWWIPLAPGSRVTLEQK
jgi:hypothetical protein